MKTVSKFSIAYIVSGIFILVIPLLIAFMACFFSQYNLEGKDFIYSQENIIRFAIATFGIFAFYFFYFGRFTRITVTNDYICLNNLITRKKKFIKYEEIAEIKRYVETVKNDGNLRRFSWNYATSRYYFNIILKNGKIIYFNDFPYDDFEDVEDFMFENFNKNK